MQTAVEATPEQVKRALQVFTDYIQMLEESGYHKVRVDTWTGPRKLINVRVGYAGGEWRLHITDAARDTRPYVVKFDIHYPLPTVEQLLEATVLREEGPSPHEMDARREMTIRGEE